ncbi:hypothetical protein EII41_12295 [Tannerella forsythia]|uniref:Uncharacterized protein n=2 Tax=Tannerella forsythia TaxID=28112 RepID=A0A3P1YIV2_TANFO|nr:hypothetical protein EII41_12295 [Tannerella forsythia]
MILTDYYRFERLATKAKSRMDCTASTMTYEEFEEKRATKATRATEHRDAINVGDLVFYYNDVPPQFGGNVHRKADKSISIKSKNLSSVYVPDPNTNFAYGDFKGTSDALLFVFHDLKIIDGVIQAGAIIEVFVARGKSKDRVPLYNALCDGELDEEMNALKKQVTKTVTEPEKQ